MIKIAKSVYKALRQNKREIFFSEKYVYGKVNDVKFRDLVIRRGSQFFVKSRSKAYDKRYTSFFQTLYSEKFTDLSGISKNVLCWKERDKVAIEKEIVGTVERKKNFELEITLEKHYNVEYAQDVNLASKMSGCNKRYI